MEHKYRVAPYISVILLLLFKFSREMIISSELNGKRIQSKQVLTN